MKFLPYFFGMVRTLLGLCCGLVSLWLCSSPGYSATLLEQLGLQRPSASPGLASLSEEQVISGLKDALLVGVQYAVTNLGRPDGFLKDPQLRVPLPDSLQTVATGLRSVGQGALADEFIVAMNRAAEQAVPAALSVLKDSVRQMSISDAKTILTGTNTAATDYFRRTASTNLSARFLPIVKKATDEAGVTSAYKRLLDKTSIGGFRIGSLGGLGNRSEFDIDSYITQKALAGLFTKVGEQEKLIRENPAARSTELLQKVFGILTKR